MDESKQKRAKIFKDYKESIKRAKFAPLSKYALNIGNPNHVTNKLSENAQINQNVDEVFYEYRMKLLEGKIKKLTIISFASLLLAFISIIIVIYQV